MTPWARTLAGRLEQVEVDAPSLRGNPLGDPAVRPLWVYLPPGYDPSGRYRAVYWLHGVTGSVDKWANRTSFRPNAIERFDEAFASGAVPPCLLVFPDGWTSVGGAQWIDSPGTGRYATYLARDVVAHVDAHYATIADRDHRALAGKSSGGYGALVHGMLHADVWGAIASHAGDALFEHCYLPHFRDDVRALARYDGSWEAFWADFRSRVPFSKPADFSLLNTYCMASCYSADADGTVRLPFDLRTGAALPEVWDRWLAWDPVRMVARHTEALRSLRGIWIDSGRRDQWFLDLGATAVHAELERAGIPDRFELFDATHDGIEYRYPLSLAWLLERLAP